MVQRTIRNELAEWPEEDYNRKNRASNPHRRKHRETTAVLPFVAWDGEGYTDDDGEHHYMLFGNSTGHKVMGDSLTWKECFPLLLENREGINVIFGGDYDIIMMIKSMPWKIRERLLDGQWTRYGGYRMRWFRRKFFRLSEVTPIDGKYRRSTTLYDVHSFFQCSFVNACKEYLGDDETLQAMHQMKLKRDSFTLDDTTVDAYWLSELDYLVRLCNTLRDLLAAVNIKPRGWYGPGAVASALMSQHKMQRFYQNPIPDDIIDIAEKAYYGGRFEQFKVGKLDQVYEYDIRSAYPNVINRLPDFGAALWCSNTYMDSEYPERIFDFGLYCVSWDIDRPPYEIGPLPWRDRSGRIFYPLKGYRSWYWGIEIKQCITRTFPKESFQIHESRIPTWENDVTRIPFRWVEAMYDDRARMKADGNPAQKALKLGLNSLYGKLAQSAGTRKTENGYVKPKWHNVLWAGYITAFTRGMIYNAARASRATVVAIETDAIFTTKPLPDIDIGTRLGQWEQTDIERILYVHSGIYYALNGGVWKLKSRGVEADKSKSADHWIEIFARLPSHPVDITLKLRRFGTDIRQTKRFGNWYTFETTTNIPNAFSKRMHNTTLCLTCIAKLELSYADSFHSLVVPQVLIDSEWQESTPYKFPWREDVTYEWNAQIKSEVIEAPEDIAWI